MKLRRSLRMHNLKRQRIRMSWNKYNLYNLSKLKVDEAKLGERTFFQQKWSAKAMTRAYHGEHIKEGQWERMFSRKIQSVVDMYPRYMAQNDGSEQALGRGSGKQRVPNFQGLRSLPDYGEGYWNPYASNIREKTPTPYMQMTYAPMERRLDIAIFRALFASSARQARQFVVHGFVKVNGQPMRFPGYLLNPGDMFQVDPDRVMMATGAKKGNLQFYLERQKNGSKRPASIKGNAEEDAEVVEEDAEAAAEETTDNLAAEPVETEPEDEAAAVEKNKEDLRKLLASAKEILNLKSGKAVEAKRKQKLRAFTKEAKQALSRAGQKHGSAEDSTIEVEELSNLLSSLEVSPAEAQQAAENEIGFSTEPNSYESLTESEKRRFHALMEEYNENPVDFSKPYWTPWKPRKWVAPFVFIPKYLEVNQNVCSAVYLRHPVVRAGQSEVPSPFPEFIGQLSFNWYLRRR